jgi:hypothetical protein
LSRPKLPLDKSFFRATLDSDSNEPGGGRGKPMIINLTVDLNRTGSVEILGDICDEEGEPMDATLSDEQRAEVYWEIGKFLNESFREEESAS